MAIWSEMNYSKYTATGNNFITVDNRNGCWRFSSKDRLRNLALKESVDGILFLEESTSRDFYMRIFNSDGREVDMCGNGLRALTYFAYFDLSMNLKKSFKIQTPVGDYRTTLLEDGKVKVEMPGPKGFQKYNHHKLKGFFLNTGVPHLVYIVDNIDRYPVFERGRELCFKGPFEGEVNINFVALTGEDQAKIRTYERGVYGETLSCGTGTLAAGHILRRVFDYGPLIEFAAPGGILVFAQEKDLYSLYGEVKKIK